MPERVCGASWLKSYPEVHCQLEPGHVRDEHYYKSKVFSVIWVGERNMASQKKILLQGEEK
jgi:hypothetical protein